MLTARSDERFLSRPCPVIFAGWRSNTAALQQAGWQLSAEQNFADMRLRIALHFAPAHLYMVAESQSWDFMGAANYYRGGDGDVPTFYIRHAASDICVNLHETSFDFQPFDAKPQFTTQQRRMIEDFGIFAPCLARTEEIIVEPQTVAGLLAEIKKLQAPELAAIRERNRQAERRGGSTEPMQQQRFHAQIVSLAA